MKIKDMRALLADLDDELDLYIETSNRYNSNCFYSSKPGVKLFLSKNVLTNNDVADIIILEDKNNE